jgi:hypothetical protein
MRLMTSLLLGLILAASAAHAASDPLRAAVFRSEPPAPVAIVAPADPPRVFGMPRTAIEGRFGRDGLTGQAGFLCGLQPKAGSEGAAAAYGVDPNGRFVGVKLRMVVR